MSEQTTWIDTHAHLEDAQFDTDRDEAIARAREAGVTEIINVGIDVARSRRVLELAHAHDGLWAVVGVHPHNADGYDDEQREAIRGLAADPKAVAIGEIGLDFFRDWSDPDAQRRAFRDQLALADELGLPIVIHCRDAQEETVAMLDAHRRTPYRGVFHCFGGTPAEAEAVLERGFHVSFTGPVTFKKADDRREAARAVPLDRVLTETDAPYMAPVPKRGKRNEPAFVVHTARALAALYEVDEAEFSRITRENTYRLFGRMAPA